MKEPDISRSQLWAWLLAAVSAPAARILGECSWYMVLPVALLCWGLWALASRCGPLPRWMVPLELALCLAFLWKSGAWAASGWGEDMEAGLLALPLLALAAWSASGGAWRAARAGSSLLWLMALLYALVAGAAVKELRPEWLVLPPQWRGEGLAILLLPCLAAFLPRRTGTGLRWPLALLGASALLSLLVTGTMGQGGTFLNMARSMSLFGVVQRFEAVVSAAVTMGWFALMSLLLSAVYHLCTRLHPKWGTPAVWTCAALAAGLQFVPAQIPGGVLSGAALICWGLFPAMAQGVAITKKIKKSS